jgi:4-hydroxy-tetrahydrodipicolinate synthase
MMGTTGEGAAIPVEDRPRIVERTVARVAVRARIFVGLGDEPPPLLSAANDYVLAGADAIVARTPVNLAPELMLAWFTRLLDGIRGPLLMYNMPMTTKTSIPLDTVAALIEHPSLAGIKDSENNAVRLAQLLHRFGNRPDFSVFVGVGALMEAGLKAGADGIVPSVGNLIPDVCHRICLAARAQDWRQVEELSARMNAVAALYQKGRTLNESLAVLKGAMSCRGLCLPHVLPPLRPLTPAQLEKLQGEMAGLQLLTGVA